MRTVLGTTIQERYGGIRECAKEGSTWEDSVQDQELGFDDQWESLPIQDIL